MVLGQSEFEFGSQHALNIYLPINIAVNCGLVVIVFESKH